MRRLGVDPGGGTKGRRPEEHPALLVSPARATSTLESCHIYLHPRVTGHSAHWFRPPMSEGLAPACLFAVAASSCLVRLLVRASALEQRCFLCIWRTPWVALCRPSVLGSLLTRHWPHCFAALELVDGRCMPN